MARPSFDLAIEATKITTQKILAKNIWLFVKRKLNGLLHNRFHYFIATILSNDIMKYSPHERVKGGGIYTDTIFM
jgi:hypothetical protein